MKNKNENEELQSRREFFKKAAKAALPVIGAVVVASIPTMKAEAVPGCQYGCSYACSGSCAGSCRGGCQGSCNGSCMGSSKGW